MKNMKINAVALECVSSYMQLREGRERNLPSIYLVLTYWWIRNNQEY